ncbi:zinc transporter foi [Condylostylus longicornis]|uniref:zinc transporter foi n=1 Tax=Condylostylus longicornis TaxID=2530218 RepID=UPI00244DA4EC|nr:zinc transporter foi [Condylostylus longicornis]
MLSELNECLAENKKYNRYLTFLFRKYGNGATITFEGLEHLMHNLGIGDLEFSPTHTIEEHFPTGYTPPDITSDEDLEPHPKSILKNSTLLQGGTDSQKFIRNVIEYNDEFQILTNEVDFKEMHDPKHYHPKQIEAHDHDHGHGHGHGEPVKKPTKICLSPRGILNLISDESIKKRNKEIQEQVPRKTQKLDDDALKDEDDEMLTLVKITPSTFLKICPALLVQLDQQICSEYAPITFVTSETSLGTSEFIYSCIYAAIAITILSACGLFGILIVPLMKSFLYNEILKFLVAVAVGTLGGDALMHLIPHALLVSNANSPSGRNSFHDHMDSILIFGCTFLTIIFMYCIESLLPLIRGEDSHGHGHAHSHGGHNHHRNHHENLNNQEPPKIIINNHQDSNNACSNEHNPESNNTMLDENKLDSKEDMIDLPMTPVAFMVVIGDGLHNLTDGLAIGAAFAADPVTGMATAFAVLCHELPHELGDFALLIQTGLSIRRAVYLNIVSSILSFIGMAFGLVIAGMHAGMVKWIYACTAGSFLYIALTDLIPELEKSKKSFANTLIQILGILLGGLIMLLIALNETSLRTLFE